MAGYWTSLFRVVMDRDEVEGHRKRTRPISSHLDRITLVKNGFLIRPRGYTNISFDVQANVSAREF